MKTTIRYQSRVLLRRSYKPARANPRAVSVTFRPHRPFTVKVAARPGTAMSPIAAVAEAEPSG